MATAKKSTPTRLDNEEAEEGSPWQSMLDQLASGQAGPFYFIKDGRTRLRLVPEPGTEGSRKPSFFMEVPSTFRGRTRSKFLLSAVVMDAGKNTIPDDKQNKVIPVVVAKGVLADILNLLVEGWDLFDAEEGHGLTIVRTGSGLSTEYAVTPSSKPVPVADDVEPMEFTLEEAKEKFIEQQAARAAQQGDESETEGAEEEEAPAPKKKNFGGKGSGKSEKPW